MIKENQFINEEFKITLNKKRIIQKYLSILQFCLDQASLKVHNKEEQNDKEQYLKEAEDIQNSIEELLQEIDKEEQEILEKEYMNIKSMYQKK